jgi:phospholipase C
VPACFGTILGYAQIARFEHVVIIVQENRTPDKLFQGLCEPPFGSNASCSTTPNSSQYDIQVADWIDRNSAGGTTEPQPVPLANRYDLGHSHAAFVAMCDEDPVKGDCKMDGASGIRCIGACPSKPQFRFIDNSTGIVNPYLQIATQYGWANYMFQTNQGPSFPAHQFLFGGTSAPTAFDDASGIFAAENTSGTIMQGGCTVPESITVALIDPSGSENQKIYPCFDWQENVDLAPTDVLRDIANCNLRSLSWVIPTGANSDHARFNDGGGPSWVASIVNAIGNSNTCENKTGYWRNTAIFITWDDWGGWYDHEAPTLLAHSQYEYGFRVPLLVVSAYTRKGYINNARQDFGSILRFIEHNFGIQEPSLNFADARATNNLTGFFNLHSPPRVFHSILAPKSAAFFLNDTRPVTDPDDQ